MLHGMTRLWVLCLCARGLSWPLAPDASGLCSFGLQTCRRHGVCRRPRGIKGMADYLVLSHHRKLNEQVAMLP